MNVDRAIESRKMMRWLEGYVNECLLAMPDSAIEAERDVIEAFAETGEAQASAGDSSEVSADTYNNEYASMLQAAHEMHPAAYALATDIAAALRLIRHECTSDLLTEPAPGEQDSLPHQDPFLKNLAHIDRECLAEFRKVNKVASPFLSSFYAPNEPFLPAFIRAIADTAELATLARTNDKLRAELFMIIRNAYASLSGPLTDAASIPSTTYPRYASIASNLPAFLSAWMRVFLRSENVQNLSSRKS